MSIIANFICLVYKLFIFDDKLQDREIKPSAQLECAMNKTKPHINLGTIFQSQRMKLGLSIEQTHQAIKINKKYLEMMENNDWSFTNSQTTINNYIRSYSKLLLLNEKLTLDLHKSAIYKPISENVNLVDEKKLNNNFSKSTLLISAILLIFLYWKICCIKNHHVDLFDISGPIQNLK